MDTNIVKTQSLTNKSGSYTLTKTNAGIDQMVNRIVNEAFKQYRITDIRNQLYAIFQQDIMPNLKDQPGQPRLFKRIQTAWKERIKNGYVDFKLSDDLSAIVADIQREETKEIKIPLYWRITSRIEDVGSGYGNAHSCYFRQGSGYSQCPEMLEDAHAVGLLIATDPDINRTTGVARTWIVNAESGELITFNPYMEIPANDITNPDHSHTAQYLNDLIATKILNLTANKPVNPRDNETVKYTDANGKFYQWKEIELPHSERMYINDDDTGYILIEEGNRNYEVGEPFGNSDNDYHCDGCGCTIDEDEVMYSPGGDAYCESCFNENYTICPDCGGTHCNDDMTEAPNGDSYCNNCISDHATECENCNELIDPDDIESAPNGDSLCNDCINDLYPTCNECDERHSESASYTAPDGTIYCEGCLDDADKEVKSNLISDAIKHLMNRIKNAPYILTCIAYNWRGTNTPQMIADSTDYQTIINSLNYHKESGNTDILNLTVTRLFKIIETIDYPERLRIFKVTYLDSDLTPHSNTNPKNLMDATAEYSRIKNIIIEQPSRYQSINITNTETGEIIEYFEI